MKEIELTQGYKALVDDGDYEWLNQWKWYYSHGYARRWITVNKKKKSILMHRLLMNLSETDKIFIDHINRNKLDNRKENLRTCTHQQNQHNRTAQNNKSGYKGVYWYESRKKWVVRITINKKTLNFGGYDDKEEAAKAYNEVALKYHGEFAYLNDIQ